MTLNTALCTGIGATIMGAGAWALNHFGINAKIVAALKGLKGDTTIKGHPKMTEALDALEDASLDVLKDLVTKHPDVLDVLEKKLSEDSLTNVGGWLAANYGPEIVQDAIAKGEALLGTELKIIFGGQKAVEEAAVQRLGVAAQKHLPTLKQIVTLPSGMKVVVPVAPAK